MRQRDDRRKLFSDRRLLGTHRPFANARRAVAQDFLTITNTAVVAWPAPSTGFTLQRNTNLLVTFGWVDATNTVNVVGSENQIIVSPPNGNRFYRLHLP